jgi:hypothetical protein
MYSAHSFHPAARTPFLVILLALITFPLSATVLRAQQTGPLTGLSAADREVIASHLLTMDDMRKVAAIMREFSEQAERDRKICGLFEQEVESIDALADLTIAGRVRAIEASPVMRTVLKASGVSAREWVVIDITRTAVIMELVGAFADDPLEVHPANLEFFQKHLEEMDQLYNSISSPCSTL